MKANQEELQIVVTADGRGKKRSLFLFAGIIIVLIAGIIWSAIALSGGSSKKVAEQLNLGNKYLDELDFERAIVAYEAVLEIDPKNAEAYIGLIDAYGAKEDAGHLAEIYLKAAGEFTGEKDAEEIQRVRAEAVMQLESLIRRALAAGDYSKAEDYATQLAKVDEEKAGILKAQIAEAKVKAEAERKARLAAELEGVGTGEVITFGHYEQDNDTANGAEPIEWVVLTREGDRALVVSVYGLDCNNYNEEYADMTWETCTLRKWLNDSFYNIAFDNVEQERIIQVTNENPDSDGYFRSDYAQNIFATYGYGDTSSWGADGGNATADHVFLLSWAETLEYFSSDEARRCTPTVYASERGAGYNDYYGPYTCWWWLRSPAYVQDIAMYVDESGRLEGSSIMGDTSHGAVRPAMWITE